MPESSSIVPSDFSHALVCHSDIRTVSLVMYPKGLPSQFHTVIVMYPKRLPSQQNFEIKQWRILRSTECRIFILWHVLVYHRARCISHFHQNPTASFRRNSSNRFKHTDRPLLATARRRPKSRPGGQFSRRSGLMATRRYAYLGGVAASAAPPMRPLPSVSVASGRAGRGSAAAAAARTPGGSPPDGQKEGEGAAGGGRRLSVNWGFVPASWSCAARAVSPADESRRRDGRGLSRRSCVMARSVIMTRSGRAREGWAGRRGLWESSPPGRWTHWRINSSWEIMLFSWSFFKLAAADLLDSSLCFSITSEVIVFGF